MKTIADITDIADIEHATLIRIKPTIIKAVRTSMDEVGMKIIEAWNRGKSHHPPTSDICWQIHQTLEAEFIARKTYLMP